MKTNQILTRKMGSFDVLQRTEDGMFNATILLKQWNKDNGMGKKIDNYFENKSTSEFISTITSRENLNTLNSVYLKSRGKYSGGTWMHPLLFIDFSMWINPEFKYDALKFVYDELIKFRNDAGDAYLEMSSAVARISPKKEIPQSISKVAQAINFIAFGFHEKEIRNKGDENSMRELVKVEKDIAMLINDGFIKSFDALMIYLRKRWADKYQPKILQA